MKEPSLYAGTVVATVHEVRIDAAEAIPRGSRLPDRLRAWLMRLQPRSQVTAYFEDSPSVVLQPGDTMRLAIHTRSILGDVAEQMPAGESLSGAWANLTEAARPFGAGWWKQAEPEQAITLAALAARYAELVHAARARAAAGRQKP